MFYSVRSHSEIYVFYVEFETMHLSFTSNQKERTIHITTIDIL